MTVVWYGIEEDGTIDFGPVNIVCGLTTLWAVMSLYYQLAFILDFVMVFDLIWARYPSFDPFVSFSVQS